MRFTRRRWDLWCLGGALFLALGGLADTLLLSGKPWQPLKFAAVALALLPLRFDIPPEGRTYTPISRLQPAHRRLILWVVVNLPLLAAAGAVAPRLEAWWICPIAAAAHLAVTLALARRADLERGVR
jgi:hypothetical protein